MGDGPAGARAGIADLEDIDFIAIVHADDFTLNEAVVDLDMQVTGGRDHVRRLYLETGVIQIAHGDAIGIGQHGAGHVGAAAGLPVAAIF